VDAITRDEQDHRQRAGKQNREPHGSATFGAEWLHRTAPEKLRGTNPQAAAALRSTP